VPPAPWPLQLPLVPPQALSLAPPPGRPSTRTGRCRVPSLRHPSKAFRCSRWAPLQGPALVLPPGRPRLTHPWAEPRTGQYRTPSSQHPSMASRCNRWDPHPCCLDHSSHHRRRRGSGSGTPSPSLNGARSPTSVTNWVADSGATNHTTPHPGHISSPMPPSVAHPSSNIVGNDSVLPVSSIGDSVLPGPFYLNDVLQ
jgi:hypothetical protein